MHKVAIMPDTGTKFIRFALSVQDDDEEFQRTAKGLAGFATYIEFFRREHENGLYVDSVNPDDAPYLIVTMGESSDGEGGWSFAEDIRTGELKHVTSSGGNTEHIRAALDTTGATWLTVYEPLVPYYQALGFTEVTATVPWDDAYMPEGWNKDIHGTPRVVTLRRKRN